MESEGFSSWQSTPRSAWISSSSEAGRKDRSGLAPAVAVAVDVPAVLTLRWLKMGTLHFLDSKTRRWARWGRGEGGLDAQPHLRWIFCCLCAMVVKVTLCRLLRLEWDFGASGRDGELSLKGEVCLERSAGSRAATGEEEVSLCIFKLMRTATLPPLLLLLWPALSY